MKSTIRIRFGLFLISCLFLRQWLTSKGIAVTGLKLEDFELRVDGQLKAISDLDAHGNQCADGDAFRQ